MIHKNKENQRRYKKLYKQSGNGYNITGAWYDKERGRYVRIDYYQRRKKVLKKQSNRKVRYFKGDLTNPSDYKKVYDYWWNLY